MARFRNSIFGYNKNDVCHYLEAMLNDSEENIVELKREKGKNEELLQITLKENEELKSQKEDVFLVLSHAVVESKNIIESTQRQIEIDRKNSLDEIGREVLEYRERAMAIKQDVDKEMEQMESAKLDLRTNLNSLNLEYEIKLKKINKLNNLIDIYKSVLDE